MRRRWFWSAPELLPALILAAALAAAIEPAHAKVLEHKVAVEVDARGKVTERWRLRVLVETLEDVDEWRSYPVYLDDNRRLLSLEGAVIGRDGGRQKIGRKEQDLMQAAGGGIFHSSARYQVVEWPGVQPGSTLELAFAVEGEPYWPGGVLPVVPASEAIDAIELSLRVDPAAGGLFYRLDGPATGLQLEETAQSLTLRGSRPQPEPLPALAGGGAVREPCCAGPGARNR